MPNKMKSRKFWVAIVPMVTGIITTAIGTEEGNMFAIVAGAVITILCALGYLKAEGEVDKARAMNGK